MNSFETLPWSLCTLRSTDPPNLLLLCSTGQTMSTSKADPFPLQTRQLAQGQRRSFRSRRAQVPFGNLSSSARLFLTRA